MAGAYVDQEERIELWSDREGMPDWSSQNASEIARLCGFADASSFAQHFRKRIGMTPTEYRERMR